MQRCSQIPGGTRKAHPTRQKKTGMFAGEEEIKMSRVGSGSVKISRAGFGGAKRFSNLAVSF